MAGEVVLRQRWILGSQIGDPSGFGRVFEAVAGDGTVGVVKFIPKQPGAERELLFEDLAGAPNIVPILETGDTPDAWLIAMPRADSSLRSVLKKAEHLSEAEAVEVLIDVARALAALNGRVVHRDLKPENILRLNGSWCLADFGIARYAEASTAPDTWKFAWTAPYAAPERWRHERAEAPSDVYSLGVMAFEMIAGRRPFPGPSWEDFLDQHLYREAPNLPEATPALASLVEECLFKAPGARPTSSNLVSRLERSLAAPSPAAGRLQLANQAIRNVEAREQAQASAAVSVEGHRKALFEDASRILQSISAQMRTSIIDNAPAADQDPRSTAKDWALRLGTASIGMDPAKRSSSTAWGAWRPVFDVVAFAEIGITIPEDRHGYTGRTHSLWYCDAELAGAYRWFETAFMVGAVMPRTTRTVPFAFAPSESAGKALSPGLAEWQLAWPFTPIDQGEENSFIERWLDWFGLAAQGKLHTPSALPERSTDGSYRVR
jgi:eukaryotic-like serine/threonine-protein kinase